MDTNENNKIESKTTNKSIHNGHRKRMRQKFIEKGAESFLPHEILEMLLFASHARCDTNALAHSLIDKFGSFHDVVNAPIEELLKVKGVGETTAFLIKLIPASTAICVKETCSNKRVLNNPLDFATEFRVRYIDAIEEISSALLLDSKRKVIKWLQIGKGDNFTTSIDMKSLLKEVIDSKAAYAILCHNHPSGIALPSEDDISTTQTVSFILQSVGCKLLDHIILSDDDFVSISSSRQYSNLFN